MASSAMPNNFSGHDYDFISALPDRIVCKICHLPSRDPYLSVCCGHIFCKSCLNNVKKAAAITNACPVCRDKNFVTFPNKAVDREVKELHIYCTNKEKGCEWQGELNDINNHLGNSKGCRFEEVKCPNRCKKIIQRQYLTSHIKNRCPRRKVNCRYCHDTVEHQFIEGQHKEECPKLPLPCPNKCEVGSVLREDMEAHRKECPLEMIQCEYYSVGCKRARLVRKHQENHDKQKMEEHLTMTKNELINTKAQLQNTTAQLDTAVNQITSLAMLVNAQLTPTVSDADLRSFQLVSMVALFKHTCPVTIMMTEYKDKKDNITEWLSDPFYTYNKGYEMCLCIDDGHAGKGKGTHLSVYLCLMKGPHDDELTWPLRGKFEIKLLNQISDSEHHSITVTFDDDDIPDCCSNRVTGCEGAGGLGEPKFISNNNLHKITPTCQFLKDDRLFFQVSFTA